jgi:hypothetical protein
MIEFSEKDFQLAKIRRESKLFNLQTAHAFRVYGLRTKGNPLVHISYNYDTVNDSFDDNMAKLVDFCKNNGIEMKWESGDGTPKVCIGLRRDLRDHIMLCSAIVQTIIYCLEGQLDINDTYKVKGIPVFPNARGVVKQPKNALPVVDREDEDYDR